MKIRVRHHHGITFFGVIWIILFLNMLSTFVVFTEEPQIENRNAGTTIAKIDDLNKAIAAYRVDNGGANPPDLDELVLDTPPPNPCTVDLKARIKTGWCGPYMDQIFRSHPINCIIK